MRTIEKTNVGSISIGKVLNFQFWDWCLACNRFSSGGRKERQGAKGSLKRNSRKLIWVRRSKKSFLRRQPKHISPNIMRVQENPKLFSWKTEFQCFPYICSPSELELKSQKTVNNIVRSISLENTACKFSQLSVGQRLADQFRLILHLFQIPAICFLTLHHLPQAWEEAEKEKPK